MNAIIRRVVLLIVVVFVSVSLAAQRVPPSHPVPRLVQFHGTLKDLSGVVGATFALYSEPSGGAPLWLETQNVNVGPDGGYTVLLGTSHRDGVPLEIFSGNEARWLGVQAEGRTEEPRVLLVSVPYALKAADAETLGGRPPSSYVLALPDGKTETRPAAATGASSTSTAASQTTFSDTTSDQVVLVQQNGSGSALNAQSTSGAAIMATNSATSGIGYAIFASNNSPEGHALEAVANSATGLNYAVHGTTRSNAGIGVLGEATSATGNTFGVVGMASSPNGVGIKSYSQNIGIWAEAAGSTGNTLGLVATAYSPAGTAAMFANHAGGKLFSGQVMGVEKFKVDGNGNVFANAYFDLAGNGIGGGGGTITGVTAGSGLTGGGTSGNVTLNLDSTVVRNFSGSTSLGSLTLSGGLAGTTAGFSGSNTSSILSASQAGDGIPVPAVNAIPPAAVSGTATATSKYVAGLLGSSTASPNGAGVLGVNLASAGLYDSAPGVWGVNFNATNGVGVFGEADEATNTDAAANGFPIGVYGASMSPIGVGVGGVDQAPVGRTLGVWGGVNSVNGYAVEGNAYDTCLTVPTDGCGPNGMQNHFGIGVAGYSEGDHGKGVVGYALHATGSTIGVRGHVVSPAGIGGLFENYAGGDILAGASCDGTVCDSANPQAIYVFRIDNHGRGYFNGGYQTSGADFAESFAVRGGRSQYGPGDLLAIDESEDRRLVLALGAYSTAVAGIYSTKPGVLATAHQISSSEVEREVPLAVIGVVPCKATAENGPIRRGDLLVSSSKAGYAMKGSDRSRMVGAVVGKALQPLDSGEGVIEVLVTLQ